MEGKGVGGMAGEEFGDEGEGALGGGESDAVGAEVGDGIEALEGEGEVGSALVGDEGVDFIDDDGLDVAEGFAAAGGGEEDVQGFRGGDKDVGRKFEHAGAVARGSVSGADHGADGRHEVATGGGKELDFGERLVEVLLDIVAEGLEGGDVEDVSALGEASGEGEADERVEAGEEGGEGFAASGGSGDECVTAGEDVGPSGELRLGGSAEAGGEPLTDDGMRPGERIWGGRHRS